MIRDAGVANSTTELAALCGLFIDRVPRLDDGEDVYEIPARDESIPRKCSNKATARILEIGADRLTIFLSSRLRFYHQARRDASRPKTQRVPELTPNVKSVLPNGPDSSSRHHRAAEMSVPDPFPISKVGPMRQALAR